LGSGIRKIYAVV
jgi:hypothetical protein